MVSFLLRGRPHAVMLRAALLIGLIAFADWRIEANIPLGFLYLFPMVLMGSAGTRWQIAVAAALCSFLTEWFDTFAWSPELGAPRDILIFAAFFCMGLFVFEMTRSRLARWDAEEQLKILVETSPAAILTMDGGGHILLANDAAHRLLVVQPGMLAGKTIADYLPALLSVPPRGDTAQSFRTVMQCRGRRQDGDAFLADVWFSTYSTRMGPRLAAMVVDTSEDLRNREEFSLHQLLAGLRILVGAVSHEIRNVCGAIAMVHANLARSGTLAVNKDFEALGTLILALEKIAAMDLRHTAKQASSIDLPALLEEFRIVVEPTLRDAAIETRWEVEPGLPRVWADRQSLMQVFLNLIKNSERAMLGRRRREMSVSARRENQNVVIQFRDSGCGVPHPERLFRPFQQEAQATGLGLYLSRAFMRSFRGDLRYEAEPDGASFVVELSPVRTAGRMMMIRILLVDDHGLFRESLSRLLQAEPDIAIVGTCASVDEAVAVVERESVDLVLLDYDLGEEQGFAFLEEASRRALAVRILMVTAGMNDALTLRALEAGASGIFLKHSPPAQLIEAIHKVMSGEMWLDSGAVRSLVAGANVKSDEQRTAAPLTERERTVLRAVFEGLTNKEIAARMQLSESSVKAAMQQLFDKTGVRTRSQLVRIALERQGIAGS